MVAVQFHLDAIFHIAVLCELSHRGNADLPYHLAAGLGGSVGGDQQFPGASTLFGPFRDYWRMAKFPAWALAYSPGLAIAATYFTTAASGHAMTRLLAGPAPGDDLARRSWAAAYKRMRRPH